MRWFKRDDRSYFSTDGYQISITSGLDGTGWLYTAWTPEHPQADAMRRCLRGKGSVAEAKALGYRVRYPRGHAIPQIRAVISTHQNPEAARQACEQHRERQQRDQCA